MLYDILHRLQENNANVTHNDFICNKASIKIGDQAKPNTAENLSDFDKGRPRRTREVSNHLIRVLHYDSVSSQLHTKESVLLLNKE